MLDTNILVRAAGRGEGAAKALISLVLRSQSHVLVTSPFILAELERVLAYERIRRIAKLDLEGIQAFVSDIRAVSELVWPGAAPRVVPDDADDDNVVHTAVQGMADCICTVNKDFFHPAVTTYCAQRGITVCGDVALLEFLRAEGGVG